MVKNLVPIAVVALLFILFPETVRADNTFTQEQMVHMTQLALVDYTAIQPDMAKSISGFKITTAAPNAKVIIYMSADGMNMTANYLCVPQDADFGCHFQN